MRVTVLGSGASSGVPLIGCDCSVCSSSNPKNRRTRVSILIEVGNSKLLVDTSPDLRTQAISNGIKKVDAIFFTHAHADHVHGIDDTRSFNYHLNQHINIYGDNETLAEIQQRFPYAFKPAIPEYGWFRPCLVPNIIGEEMLPFKVTGEFEVRPFRQFHGKIQTLGLRVNDFAYSTDVNNLPEESFQALRNTKIWLVDCLRYHPAPTHAHLEMTLDWIERVKPELAILTHMGHEFDYETLLKELPASVVPAYDGMVIDL